MASVRALGGSLGPPAAALPQRGKQQTGTLAGRSRRPRDRRRQRLNPPIWFLLLPTRGSRRRPGVPGSKLPSLPAPAASPPPARPQAHTSLPLFHPGRPAFAGPLTSPGEDGGSAVHPPLSSPTRGRTTGLGLLPAEREEWSRPALGAAGWGGRGRRWCHSQQVSPVHTSSSSPGWSWRKINEPQHKKTKANGDRAPHQQKIPATTTVCI